MIKKIAVKSSVKKQTSNNRNISAPKNKAAKVATPAISQNTAKNYQKKIIISSKNSPEKRVKTSTIQSITIKPVKNAMADSRESKQKNFITSVKSQPKKSTSAKKTVIKTVTSKNDTKKTTAKKTVSISTATTAKKDGKKPSIKIEIPAVRTTPEIVQKPLEPHKSKGAKKPHIRPSDSVVFTIEDLDSYLEMRAAGVAAPQLKPTTGTAGSKVAAQKDSVSPAPIKATSSPKNPIAAASIFDILGFNPIETPSLEKHQEKEIPRKWKKYYNLLIDLRKQHSSGAETISQEVLKRSAKEDAGDLSSYGQHLADAGSESFERDMAYNLLSNEKEVLAEIDAAIERIKNGTYGICEITGQPIPESRLESIPFTRCTKEGQEIKENESKKIKSVQRSIYEISEAGATTEEDEQP